MHKSLLAAAALLLSACASTAPKDQLYRGEYFYNFESASFTPDGGHEAWCVNSAKLKDAELPRTGGPWGTAHVVLRGVLSADGSYCNMGAYKHFLEITEVVEISDRKSKS